MGDTNFADALSQLLCGLAPYSGESKGHYEKEISSLLTGDYLANSLSRENKIACFINNNIFLCSIISPSALKEMSLGSIIVFERTIGDNIFLVELGVIRNNLKEGGISLNFLINNTNVYTLSFTFIPGHVVGLGDWQTILISRMQGVRGKYDLIRTATKEMADISPQAVLFSVLTGIAKAIGIKHIVGPCAENQIYFHKGMPDILYGAYDGFFNSVGARKLDNGFYATDIPFPEKPLAQIKRGHRLRTKLKREIKAEISRTTLLAWQEKMANHRGITPTDSNEVIDDPESTPRYKA